MFKKHFGIIIAGALAGSVTGLMGAGGGMVLIPLLTLLTNLEENEIFPASVARGIRAHTTGGTNVVHIIF